MKCSCIVPRRRRRRHIYAWTNTSAAHTHTHLPVFEISYSPNRHWWNISLVSASFFLSFFYLFFFSLFAFPHFISGSLRALLAGATSPEYRFCHHLSLITHIVSFFRSFRAIQISVTAATAERRIESATERHTERERVNAERMLLLLLWLLRMTLFLQQRFLFFFPPLFSTHFYVENNISWRYLSFIHFMWKNTPFSSRWSFAFFFLYSISSGIRILLWCFASRRGVKWIDICATLLWWWFYYTLFFHAVFLCCAYTSYNTILYITFGQ